MVLFQNLLTLSKITQNDQYNTDKRCLNSNSKNSNWQHMFELLFGSSLQCSCLKIHVILISIKSPQEVSYILSIDLKHILQCSTSELLWTFIFNTPYMLHHVANYTILHTMQVFLVPKTLVRLYNTSISSYPWDVRKIKVSWTPHNCEQISSLIYGRVHFKCGTCFNTITPRQVSKVRSSGCISQASRTPRSFVDWHLSSSSPTMNKF